MCPLESKQGSELPEKREGKPEELTPEPVKQSDDDGLQYPWIEKEGPLPK